MRPLTTAAALIALTATAAPVQAGSYSDMPYVFQGEWCLVRTGFSPSPATTLGTLPSRRSASSRIAATSPA
jgi:hypothetical protein